MINAAAPMIGGIIWPFVDAATSIAPALTAVSPVSRITGMVNTPVVTTLAIEDPEMSPVIPDARIAAFAGPPRYFPTMAKARSKKYFPAPVTKSQWEIMTNFEKIAAKGLKTRYF